MLKQRQVGFNFDLWVRALGAARFWMVAIPLAVLVVASAVSLRAGGRADDATLEGAEAAVRGAAFTSVFPSRAVSPVRSSQQAYDPLAQDAVRSAGDQNVTARSPLKLSPEQHKIAQFVAKKYRIAVADVQHFVAHAYRTSKELRLDPYLVLAVMSIESNFNPNARSSAGAQGLMQVLTRVHVEKFAPFGGSTAAFDPVANISVGARILKEYLVREGSVEGALKSYVGAALHAHDSGYGFKVMSERERIAAAAAGKPIPARPLEPPVVATEERREVPRAMPVAGTAGADSAIVPAVLLPPDHQPGTSTGGSRDAAPDETPRDTVPATLPADGILDAAIDVPHAVDPLAQFRRETSGI
ncbi:MAG TPA: transglycosylase SLT domain-containing protein [Zeimonas sp.]|nr:transglycosylase SLT domain-containing protein [Zeimonas sp.]